MCCRTAFFQNIKPRNPSIAIPSGIPIPAPIAVGRLVECFWVEACIEGLVGRLVDCFPFWADKEELVEVEEEEDVGTLIAPEFGSAEKVVVTGSSIFLVIADGEDVRGAIPKIEPGV